MTQADLDKIEATLHDADTAPDPWAMRYYHDVRALTTELRAARELIKQAGNHRAAWQQRSCGCGVCWALGQYEAVTR